MVVIYCLEDIVCDFWWFLEEDEIWSNWCSIFFDMCDRCLLFLWLCCVFDRVYKVCYFFLEV